jgi:hypothetical protein
LETLFADVQREVDQEASERLEKLRSDLEAKPLVERNAKLTSKKLGWLSHADVPTQIEPTPQ